ncbi:MAG: hypothetical protein EU533_02880 [Promethearchaeota archaeon]|nr:MAG: hypothetical protein EU533_02880 [Candidatus Lokiarchaeota archaeon]
MKGHFSKKFIDYNKDDGNFYNNFYLDELKLVIKLPLTGKEEEKRGIQIEKFTIDNDVYLISY